MITENHPTRQELREGIGRKWRGTLPVTFPERMIHKAGYGNLADECYSEEQWLIPSLILEVSSLYTFAPQNFMEHSMGFHDLLRASIY